MKTSIASVLAVLFASQAALAQDPEPSPNPVEEQEVDASAEDGPAEGSGETVQAAPATANPAAESKDEEKWDVMAPRGATIRQVPIRTDEGTWMDVDVSPDGRMLAFSLLGDIYTMPIAGGTPTRIAEGLAWEIQPRFSPDGSRIAFTSDRNGADNIWVMNADGSDKRRVTKEDFRLLNQPTWSPDGRYIAAKKHFTTERSAGTGEVWLYHISGGGGVALVERPNPQHQKELGEPIYSADGEAIYYTRNVSSGPIFEYAQDTTQSLFEIERYDLATGETSTAVSGYGGSVRPTPSPDGKLMAFGRRERDQTKLFVKNLTTGATREIYGDLDLDLFAFLDLRHLADDPALRDHLIAPAQRLAHLLVFLHLLLLRADQEEIHDAEHQHHRDEHGVHEAPGGGGGLRECGRNEHRLVPCLLGGSALS